jgi:hypothetical protein
MASASPQLPAQLCCDDVACADQWCILHCCFGVLQVGGVMSSPQQECQQEGSSSWNDCSQALCRDVHALQADPFNPKILYAVAGSGQLPGGLYRCKGKGQKWRRLFGYR